MKHYPKILFALLFLSAISLHPALAQQPVIAEINRLEQQEMRAIVQHDTLALQRLWSPAFVVNNPANQAVTTPQVLGFLRHGQIDYATMERVVERVTVAGDVAVAMGHEVIMPQRQTDHAGHVVTRRYTNVWQRQGSGWHLLARQATIVEVK